MTAPQPESETPIYTLGYGSRTVDAVTALLSAHQIDCLVDVRSSPYSRFRPEFGKAPFQAALQQRGVRYVFLGDGLGGRPDDPSCYEDGKVDYERVKLREPYRRAIERLRRAAAQGMRVALMCSEGRPEECHRSKLIGASLTELGIPVVHLDEKDEPQPQAVVIGRLTGGQLGLFGGPEFTSRRRYDLEGADDGS